MTNPARLVTGIRERGRGKVLLAFLESVLLTEVCISFELNDWLEALCCVLDPDGITVECGASMAILNGPRFWLMDGTGKIDPGSVVHELRTPEGRSHAPGRARDRRHRGLRHGSAGRTIKHRRVVRLVVLAEGARILSAFGSHRNGPTL